MYNCFVRFKNNFRNSKNKVTWFLKTNKLKNAMFTLIKIAQLNESYNEINALKRNQSLSCSSKILALNLFINDSGML